MNMPDKKDYIKQMIRYRTDMSQPKYDFVCQLSNGERLRTSTWQQLPCTFTQAVGDIDVIQSVIRFGNLLSRAEKCTFIANDKSNYSNCLIITILSSSLLVFQSQC